MLHASLAFANILGTNTNMLLKLIVTGLALLAANNLYHLTKNYILARRLSLPIVICPFTWQNPFWVLINARFRVRRFSHIPGLDWVRYSYKGWVLHATYHSRVRFGPAFVIVSPKKNEIVLHEPKAISEALGKYKKWERPRENYAIFSLMGENVDSVNGEDWPIHRKIINAGFVEANMHIVWDAAVKQTTQWVKERTVTFKQLHAATNTISANVLMRAGFGKDYDFDDKGLNDVEKGRKKSFAEAMQFVITNLLFAWGMRSTRLPALTQSKKAEELRDSMADLKAYFSDMIRNPSGEFVEALVQANMSEKEGSKGRLNEDELYGNLFILQLAGSDTTSYSMSFTMAMLSVHPDVQDWIREEIIPGTYGDIYPRTSRCRAAIMETLRFHTAAPNLPRSSSKTETLRISGRDYVVPANTIVSSSIPCIHNDPQIWGEDAGVWKPQRWIQVLDGKETFKDRFEMMAWSTGPRICPGKKFSLVEAVAALCTVLKDYRLEGTPNIEGMLLDFEYSLTPKPNKPESGSIKFVKIHKE